MALGIIGAGFGRTGTYSLKTALEELGFGPCHHMSEVIHCADQISLWSGLTSSKSEFDQIFCSFGAAVDFPVAAYWREALAAYPEAKVILSHREAEDWYASFSQTILPLIMDKAAWPANARPWFELLEQVVIGKALGGRTDRNGILAAYRENERDAMALAETGRALVYRTGDGWGPLCAFLDVETPKIDYPRTNARAEFFASVKSGTDVSAA